MMTPCFAGSKFTPTTLMCLTGVPENIQLLPNMWEDWKRCSIDSMVLFVALVGRSKKTLAGPYACEKFNQVLECVEKACGRRPWTGRIQTTNLWTHVSFPNREVHQNLYDCNPMGFRGVDTHQHTINQMSNNPCSPLFWHPRNQQKDEHARRCSALWRSP